MFSVLFTIEILKAELSSSYHLRDHL